MSDSQLNNITFLEDFDLETDGCPYCGELIDPAAQFHCNHVLSVTCFGLIAYANNDFTRVANQIYGIPDLALINGWEELYFTDCETKVPTKKFGILPAPAIESGVKEALQHKGIKMSIAYTAGNEPGQIIFLKEKLPKDISFDYRTIEEQARDLLASVYLDKDWYSSCDCSTKNCEEFRNQALKLKDYTKKISNPVEAMLFFVNGKKDLCRKFREPYQNTVKEFGLFEKEIFYKNHSSAYQVWSLELMELKERRDLLDRLQAELANLTGSKTST